MLVKVLNGIDEGLGVVAGLEERRSKEADVQFVLQVLRDQLAPVPVVNASGRQWAKRE